MNEILPEKKLKIEKQVEHQKFLNEKKNICKDAMNAVVKMTSYVFQGASHFTVYIMYSTQLHYCICTIGLQLITLYTHDL